jgi:hypothetical protein
MRLVPLLAALCTVAAIASAAAASPDAAALEALQAQYAPVELRVDLSTLPASERQVLSKLIEAAKILNGVYLRQVWAGNEPLLLALAADASPLGRARLRYFITQKGPWDRQDDQKPFIPGVPARPPEGNFYPAGATKEQVQAWMDKLPEAEKNAATGFYTTLRRAPDGSFQIVPYSVEYQAELEAAARLLDEAAALTGQATLKKFLVTRAAAFRKNDYYESEVAWMELDSAIEPTIGPYETYEDHWFSFKAAFEAFITVRDDAETAKLAKFSAELQGLEDKLPIDPKFRNPKLGALAPIRVVNQIYASGDADLAVKTAAYNLPNDERVNRERGSKRTMLKNVQEAKFRMTLLPIAKVALGAADQNDIDFEAFFTFVLMHELMHGLGPNEIVVDGVKTTPRKMLQELYGALEEAKADISGMWALQQLVDKGTLPKDMQRTMYDTYLAGAFRTLRFGAQEAHGRGMAVQLNYLLDKGGVRVAKDGTFSIDDKKIRAAVAGLTAEIMTIQAKGDKAAAKKLFDRLGVVRPEIKRVLDKLGSTVPVDIDPQFVTANELLAR